MTGIFAKDLSNFTRGPELKLEGLHTHCIFKARKNPKAGKPASPAYEAEWYVKGKKEKDPTNFQSALLEVVAQEIFRLLSVNVAYPKTRLALDDAKNPYVLSKEVPGLVILTSTKLSMKEVFENPIYQGLGDLAVFALLLNEIDLKFGNIGINPQNQFVKIDGDWCFAYFKKTANYLITPDVIDALPGPHTYSAYNWTRYKFEGRSPADSDKASRIKRRCGEIESAFAQKEYKCKKQRTQEKDSAIAEMKLAEEAIAAKERAKEKKDDEKIKNLPHIRKEINGALLRAITLPDNFIRSFVQGYTVGEDESTQAKEKRFSTRLEIFLIERFKQLRDAALQNKSFMTYLASDEAVAHFERNIKHLKEFKSAKKHKPFTSEFEKATRANFEVLRRLCIPHRGPAAPRAAAAADDDQEVTVPIARRFSR